MDECSFGDYPKNEFEFQEEPMVDWEIAFRNSLGRGIYEKMVSLTWKANFESPKAPLSPLAIRSLSLVGRYLHDCSPFLPYSLQHFGDYAVDHDGLDMFDFLEGSVIDAAYFYINECNVAKKVIDFYDEI